MSQHKIYNVIFLCIGNSGLSLIAERLLEHLGGGRFKAYSAGIFASGLANPLALQLMVKKGLPIKGLRSKSWEEFSALNPQSMDFVFTVCDNYAIDAIPDELKNVTTQHLLLPNPADIEGSIADKEKAFSKAYVKLSQILSEFISRTLDPGLCGGR